MLISEFNVMQKITSLALKCLVNLSGESLCVNEMIDETPLLIKLVDMLKTIQNSNDKELCGMLLCNLTRTPKGWFDFFVTFG
jgi:hypothetical protein